MAKRPVRQFSIGKDFTPQEIELLVLRLAKWFSSPDCDRKFDDPEQAAKEVVEQCLNATTKDGSPWQGASDDFAKRIKIKAAYDMHTGIGIKINGAKSPNAVRNLDPEAKQNGAKLDAMQPVLAHFDHTAFRESEERKLLSAYPELNNPALLPHVRRLTLLYSQQEMLDRELMLNTNAKKREDALKSMETLNKTTESLLKILDIHPESLRKKIKEAEDGTLGDLVQMLDSDDEFKERERLWADQAALQMWYMTKHMNGRGDGPQITDWELWHMTRTLPISFICSCGAFYPALIKGFTPKQLKAHLISKGILIAKPAIPKLIPEEALVGIEEFIDSLPEDA